MLAAVVVLAVLVGLLVTLLALERRRGKRRQQDADEQADSLRATVADADARAAAAEERAVLADAERDSALDAMARAETERGEVDDHVSRLETERDAIAGERDHLMAERDELVAALDDAKVQVVSSDERVAELDKQVERFRHEHRPGIEASALWALELARSERTWRHSVAAAPDAVNPFVGADDPLRLAVEVEVAALREDVGAEMGLTWDTDVDDPARCLMVLRVAQELLAVAAREQEEVVLNGRSGVDGEVVLHLTVSEGEATLDLAPRCFGDHLVTTSTDDGLRLTIR